MSQYQREDMVATLLETMVKVGQARFAYAYARSGYLVSEENHDLIPEEGLRAWSQAMQEWHEMSAEERATSLQGLVSRQRQ